MQRTETAAVFPRLAGRRYDASPLAPAIPLAGPRAPRMTETLVARRAWERSARRRLIATDVVLVLAAALGSAVIATLVTQPISMLAAFEPGLALPTFAASALSALTLIVLLGAVRSREAGLLGKGAHEYRRVANAAGLAFGVLALAYILSAWEPLRLQLLVTIPVAMVLLLAGRIQWRRWLLERRRTGEWAAKAIVVGTAEEIDYVLERLARAGDLGYHVLGAALRGASDEPATLRLDGRILPTFGNADDLAGIAARTGADSIILASSPDDDPTYLQRLSRELEGHSAELVLFTRLDGVDEPRVSYRPVDGMPLIQVRIPDFEGRRYVEKRALDVVLAALALIPVALLAIPIALAIRLDSSGPILFRQERVGRDGKLFSMLKFRTMRVNAEEMLESLRDQNEGAGPLFKLKHDPRVTRVGRFLRRTSLDELPQFWNALRGDMSIVGPRPPLPSEAASYDSTVARRLYLKPGITGLWQISGRSDLSWEESVRLDLRYVENWSAMDDLAILWHTAKLVLNPRGAY